VVRWLNGTKSEMPECRLAEPFLELHRIADDHISPVKELCADGS